LPACPYYIRWVHSCILPPLGEWLVQLSLLRRRCRNHAPRLSGISALIQPARARPGAYSATGYHWLLCTKFWPCLANCVCWGCQQANLDNTKRLCGQTRRLRDQANARFGVLGGLKLMPSSGSRPGGGRRSRRVDVVKTELAAVRGGLPYLVAHHLVVAAGLPACRPVSNDSVLNDIDCAPAASSRRADAAR
jgi:hypothetical protein